MTLFLHDFIYIYIYIAVTAASIIGDDKFFSRFSNFLAPFMCRVTLLWAKKARCALLIEVISIRNGWKDFQPGEITKGGGYISPADSMDGIVKGRKSVICGLFEKSHIHCTKHLL